MCEITALDFSKVRENSEWICEVIVYLPKYERKYFKVFLSILLGHFLEERVGGAYLFWEEGVLGVFLRIWELQRIFWRIFGDSFLGTIFGAFFWGFLCGFLRRFFGGFFQGFPLGNCFNSAYYLNFLTLRLEFVQHSILFLLQKLLFIKRLPECLQFDGSRRTYNRRYVAVERFGVCVSAQMSKKGTIHKLRRQKLQEYSICLVFTRKKLVIVSKIVADHNNLLTLSRYINE